MLQQLHQTLKECVLVKNASDQIPSMEEIVDLASGARENWAPLVVDRGLRSVFLQPDAAWIPDLALESLVSKDGRALRRCMESGSARQIVLSGSIVRQDVRGIVRLGRNEKYF
jgi:hypothetical protein